MKNNEILDIIVKTSTYASEIFSIKDARFESILPGAITECIFSWIEANGERIFYRFKYEKMNLIQIQRAYLDPQEAK